MRYLTLLLFLILPCATGATSSTPISQGEITVNPQTIHQGFVPKKHSFFERLLEKKLTKRLIKAAGATKGDGTVFAILGLLFFLLNGIFWVLSVLLGFLSVLPLAILGLLFSVWGYKKAKQWEHNGRSKTLAALGIVLNSLALLFGVVIWGLLIKGF